MKSEVMGIGNPISNEDLKEMKVTKNNSTCEQKTNDTQHAFGAVDLWNIEKRRRTTAAMRSWLN